jgi:hypothetical protein
MELFKKKSLMYWESIALKMIARKWMIASGTRPQVLKPETYMKKIVKHFDLPYAEHRHKLLKLPAENEKLFGGKVKRISCSVRSHLRKIFGPYNNDLFSFLQGTHHNAPAWEPKIEYREGFLTQVDCYKGGEEMYVEQDGGFNTTIFSDDEQNADDAFDNEGDGDDADEFDGEGYGDDYTYDASAPRSNDTATDDYGYEGDSEQVAAANATTVSAPSEQAAANATDPEAAASGGGLLRSGSGGQGALVP